MIKTQQYIQLITRAKEIQELSRSGPDQTLHQATTLSSIDNSIKIVSMIRKYYNHKPQTNPCHREEEPHNQHKTQEDKPSNATSPLLPSKMTANPEPTQSNVQQNIEQLQTATMGVTINKSRQQQSQRLRTDSSLSNPGA